jgi:hypothetical protein
MELLNSILGGPFILLGIGLFFSPSKGAGIAEVISIGAGAFAFDEMSMVPLANGFGLLWVLRLMGFEKR